MTSESRGAFRIDSWEEETFAESEGGPTLKKASVKKIYSGDLEGVGIVEYIFMYTDKNNASIYGLEHYSGRLDQKNGSFVFEHKGVFEHGIADIIWNIVPKSGSGELHDIEGQVHFKAGMEEVYTIVLKHHLNKEMHLWKKLITKNDK